MVSTHFIPWSNFDRLHRPLQPINRSIPSPRRNLTNASRNSRPKKRPRTSQHRPKSPPPRIHCPPYLSQSKSRSTRHRLGTAVTRKRAKKTGRGEITYSVGGDGAETS